MQREMPVSCKNTMRRSSVFLKKTSSPSSIQKLPKPRSTPDEDIATDKPKKKSKWWLWTLLAVAVIGAGAAAAAGGSDSSGDGGGGTSTEGSAEISW